MDRAMTSHRIVNPPSLAEPRGFAHAVVAVPGRTIWLGGQTAHDADGKLRGATLVEQFDRAAANVVEALRAAGGEVDQLVSMQLFVTDVAEYRAALTELGNVWRRWFGRRYPALALFEVSGLFDPAALVEIVAVAVVPDTRETA
jgi:enamine deaminase RidA (YjgF/YER057c/UK114 family)